MTIDHNRRKLDAVSCVGVAYAPPQLTLIGEARTVILGVAPNGDDLYGYTPPQFEFEPDEDERRLWAPHTDSSA